MAELLELPDEIFDLFDEHLDGMSQCAVACCNRRLYTRRLNYEPTRHQLLCVETRFRSEHFHLSDFEWRAVSAGHFHLLKAESYQRLTLEDFARLGAWEEVKKQCSAFPLIPKGAKLAALLRLPNFFYMPGSMEFSHWFLAEFYDGCRAWEVLQYFVGSPWHTVDAWFKRGSIIAIRFSSLAMLEWLQDNHGTRYAFPITVRFPGTRDRMPLLTKVFRPDWSNIEYNLLTITDACLNSNDPEAEIALLLANRESHERSLTHRGAVKYETCKIGFAIRMQEEGMDYDLSRVSPKDFKRYVWALYELDYKHSVIEDIKKACISHLISNRYNFPLYKYLLETTKHGVTASWSHQLFERTDKRLFPSDVRFFKLMVAARESEWHSARLRFLRRARNNKPVADFLVATGAFIRKKNNHIDIPRHWTYSSLDSAGRTAYRDIERVSTPEYEKTLNDLLAMLIECRFDFAFNALARGTAFVNALGRKIHLQGDLSFTVEQEGDTRCCSTIEELLSHLARDVPIEQRLPCHC